MFDMKFDFSGLNKMRRNVSRINNKPLLKTPFSEIFTDDFLREHTDFTSFSQIEKMDIEEFAKDEFIAAHTKFSNFEEMKEKVLSESVNGRAAIEKAKKEAIRRIFRGV